MGINELKPSVNLPLRPYQNECLEAIRKCHIEGQHRLLVSLPTGAGKTVIFANLIKETSYRTLVLAHTCELLDQAKEKIQMICPSLNVGIVNASSKQFDSDVVVCSIQSAIVPSNLTKLSDQGFDLVIADECHHFAAESPRKVLNELGFGKGTNRLLVGFTATPFRSDGYGLGEIFDVVSYERNIKHMIADGYLCSPKGLKIATDIDLSKVKSVDEDFQVSSLAEVMDTKELNEIAVDAYLKNANGKQTICFGVTVQHAKNLAACFQNYDVSAKAIYGDMPKDERANILKEYRSGNIQVLCNCNVLTEGFDAPETACVIVARPTKSKGLYQQMVGRGLRLWPNKTECIILDFCDKNHSICSSAILFEDTEQQKQEEKYKESEKEIRSALPPNLNQKLKAAIINFDPLSESFVWVREDKAYTLKGTGKSILAILPQDNDRYKVILSSKNETQLIAEGLSFEYAFATAEDFAKENRKLFVLSDLEAEWRNQPITERQKETIRSKGYRAGIENLSRGQASILIGSGALRRAS